jgi:hypothetical protein
VQPTDGAVGGATVANTEIGDRDAQITGDEVQAGIVWELADGGFGYAQSHGLSTDELHAFVEQVEAGDASLPQSLRSIGVTGEAVSSTSYCSQAASITEIRGSLPSRYAEALLASGGVDNSGEIRRFDSGGSSFVITAIPGTYDQVGTAFHDVTPEEWQVLLDAFVAVPDPNPVPSVVGLTRAEAERVLNQQLGFGVVVTQQGQGELVVQQSPAPGARVAPGSTVEIVVGG